MNSVCIAVIVQSLIRKCDERLSTALHVYDIVLDLLETFFYFNILFLAVFTWYSISNGTIKQIAVINTSVIITSVILLLIIFYHTYSYTSIFFKFHQTNIGKRLEEKFKSFSSPQTKQCNLEANEDHQVLEMVNRPTNVGGYKGNRKEHTPAEPTRSVLEVPVLIQKPADSAKEASGMKKESDHSSVSSDTEKCVVSKAQTLPHHKEI